MNTFENQTVIPATVLVVDDDPGARLLVGTALEMAGFRVVTAADGATALRRFGEQSVCQYHHRVAERESPRNFRALINDGPGQMERQIP